MGKIRQTNKVKLIVGLIFCSNDTAAQSCAILKRKFGPIDYQSGLINFSHTDYYKSEIGTNLKRQFLAFKKLIRPEKLAVIKIYANNLETKLSRNNKRLINIDPGYLDMAKLVLASTKDYKHRINIGKNIYAEITLCYEAKAFRPNECAYPDYKSNAYREIFESIRNIYSNQLAKE